MGIWIPFVFICVVGQPATCVKVEWKERAQESRPMCLLIARAMIPHVVFVYQQLHVGAPTEGGSNCEEWKGIRS